MKRFHVHVAVENLSKSVAFYSTLFGAEPTVLKSDYAKWMVDDPRINFAISARGSKPGVNHLGFQVDTSDELKDMHAQLIAADAGVVEESGANCCYAKSDKYWVTDPQGIAWETYHTLGAIPMFGADPARAEHTAASGGSCCATETAKVAMTMPVKASTGCCS